MTTPALRLDNLSKTFPLGRTLLGPERPRRAGGSPGDA